ncbi:MAG: MerR family transcriptional regulator [Bradymonadia bacterium]
MSTEERMTIGELARRVGKTPRALRLYEQMGLIKPSSRSDGGFRYYGDEALLRLRWIIRLVGLGMPLHEVKQLLDDVQTADDGGGAMLTVSEVYTRKLSEVEAQIARLTSLRAALVEALEFARVCHGCMRTGLPTACLECTRHVEAPMPDLVQGIFAQDPETSHDDRQKP